MAKRVSVRYPGRARLVQAGWPADLVEFIDALWSRTGGPIDRIGDAEQDTEQIETNIATLQATQATISGRVGDLENTPPPVEIVHDADNPLPQFQAVPEQSAPVVVAPPVEPHDPLPPIFMPYVPDEMEVEGLAVVEGADAAMGVATLVAGTATASNARVTADTRIFLTVQDTGTNPGHVYVSGRVPGSSFSISSTDPADTRPVAWLLIEPA